MLLGLSLPASAQTQQVIGDDAVVDCVKKLKNLPVDSALAICIPGFRSEGYLEASLDSIQKSGDTSRYFVHLGPLYELGDWTSTTNPSGFFGPVRLDTLALPKKLSDLEPQAEDYLEQNSRDGYPFARVRYDSLRLSEASLSGRTSTWSGPRIVYGGIRYVDGIDEPISTRYLERYLRFEPGRVYKANELVQVERRLRGITFLELRRDPVVVFESNEAYLYLNAIARKTSRFDFLLGFLPNSDANNGQLLLTGDVTLELDNSLRKGERLFFSFQRLQPEATEVELEASYPYVLDSPFGGRAVFGLYRQQDDWLRVNYELGGSYSLGGGDAFEFFYEGGVAQVLGYDTARVEQSQRLPEVLDARRDGFGSRFRLDRRDDIFDTRIGWRLVVDASAALRSVSVPNSLTKSSDILKVQADSIAGQTAQYRTSLDIEKFFPLGRRTTLAMRLRGASIVGVQQPLRNELYRIGGNRLLRGFDEQTIDAQHYAVATAEYRLLIGGGSFLFAFVDQGALENPYRSGRTFDQPTGFGAGLRLGTKGGALNLTYAYGIGPDLPFDPQRVVLGIRRRPIKP